MRIGSEQARALVRARLGREPEDYLESAVVLEAWGGLRASTALGVAPGWRAGSGDRSAALDERSAVESEGPRHVGWLVAATVIATALYLLLLERHLSGPAADAAWQVALPAALGVQWLIRRRYLSGRRSVATDVRLLGVVAVTVCGAAVVSGDPIGQAAVLTLLPWCAASLVIGSRFAVGYAAAVVAAAIGALLVPSAAVGVVLPSLVAVAIVAHAMHVEVVRSRPVPWISALPLAVPGIALGLVIVAVPAVSGSVGGFAAVLALLPTLLGNHAAGLWLRRIWEDGAEANAVVVRALMHLVTITVSCSAVLLLGAAALGYGQVQGLATALAFLVLVATLTFPLLLLDAFRFDGVLVALGALTILIMATGLDGPQALGAALVTFATSLAVAQRLLGDGRRLRAMPA